MSLKSNIYREICSKVFDPLYNEKIWRILVLDDISTQIISYILKMHDLFDKGITLVCDLNKKREPVPLEAIYLISPTTNKIQLMINDFVCLPTYKRIYVFFTDECSMENLNLIGESVAANYITGLKEININVLIAESQLFHFDFHHDENKFNSLDDLDDDTAWELARALSSLCEILNENPSIYYQKSDKAHRLAIKVQQEMAKTSMENVSLGQAIHKDQSILLILDRSFDPLTPLLHDLHLQCLIHDLLEINNNMYQYKNLETEKTTLVDLSECDDLYVQLRHMHIADVSRILPLKLKQLANAQKSIGDTVNSSEDLEKEPVKSEKYPSKDNVTKQLKLMIKRMPHLKQEANTVSNMFYLSEACLSAFQAGINQLCECEQNLVIGTDASGDPIKNPEKLLLNVINNTMPTMSEKIRLLLTLIISQSGMSEEKVLDLVQKLRIDERWNDIFYGLKQLGKFVIQNENNKTSKQSIKRFPFLIENRKDVLDVSSYTLSRWIPFIKDLISDAIRRQFNPSFVSSLDQSKPFTNYLECDPNGFPMSHRQSWSKLNEADNHVGPRLIIFILGGVSLAESRIAYDVTKLCHAMRKVHFNDQKTKKNNVHLLENGGGRGWNWEVLIGGTCILTPERYLQSLSKTIRI